jgi:hypothetical protein
MGLAIATDSCLTFVENIIASLYLKKFRPQSTLARLNHPKMIPNLLFGNLERAKERQEARGRNRILQNGNLCITFSLTSFANVACKGGAL